jgi:hypothetical protein
MTEKEKKHQYYLIHAEKIKKRSAQWAKDNPERSKQLNLKKSRRYEEKHREKRRNRPGRSRAWLKAHPERAMEIMRKHNYGITPEQYRTKKREQKNCCAICGKKETHRDHRSNKIRALSVDHDHSTNTIRDLLCGNCNRGLGMFLDSSELLLKASQYLEKYKETNGK